MAGEISSKRRRVLAHAAGPRGFTCRRTGVGQEDGGEFGGGGAVVQKYIHIICYSRGKSFAEGPAVGIIRRHGDPPLDGIYSVAPRLDNEDRTARVRQWRSRRPHPRALVLCPISRLVRTGWGRFTGRVRFARRTFAEPSPPGGCHFVFSRPRQSENCPLSICVKKKFFFDYSLFAPKKGSFLLIVLLRQICLCWYFLRLH